jgi:predicted nucleotidyltransferase component of viral defense system
MAFSEAYQKQVALLMRTLPFVAQEDCFALKGGTAINLFVRDMPRLSLDIDLTYLPVLARAKSPVAIDAAMRRLAERLRPPPMPGARITAVPLQSEQVVTKLLVRADAAQIKIEVTPVMRGCVYNPEIRSVSSAVEKRFGFAEIQVVSFADLYAGKIVAGLDRQHPRDLFDVRGLLAREGIDDLLRRAFLVYLLSHNRPLAELLAPNRIPMSVEFSRGFQGMTPEPLSLDELVAVRESLIALVVGMMPEPHRRFLVSFERGEPDWQLIGVPNARDLPAVRWKQQNLDKLEPAQRAKLVRQLEAVVAKAAT